MKQRLRVIIWVFVAIMGSAVVANGTALATYINYSGSLVVTKGRYLDTGSKIYDDGHLRIATDDYLFLNAPVQTVVQGGLAVNKDIQLYNRALGGYTGSSIVDDGHLRISTDDNLFLQAPVEVIASSNMRVVGNLVVEGTINGGSIGSIADGSITTAKLADTAVNNAKLADNSVTSAKIANNSITDVDISSSSTITMLGQQIETSELNNGAVTTLKIADGTIAAADIADGAVTAAKLASAARQRSVAVQIGDVSAGTNVERPIFVSPGNGTVVGVSFTNASAIVQDDTNYTTLSVERKTAASATVRAVTTQLTGGLDFQPFVAQRLTSSLLGTSLAAGDVYSFKKADSGSGAALDELLVTLEYLVSD